MLSSAAVAVLAGAWYMWSQRQGAEEHADENIRRPGKVDPDAKSKKGIMEAIKALNEKYPKLLPRTFFASKLYNPLAVRFLQFNMLAQGLSSSPEYGGFRKSPREALDFASFRKFRLLEEMIRFSPDVLAVEEMDHFDDFFLPALSHFGYEGVFFPKLNSPCLKFGDSNYSDGCALFWKSDMLSLASRKDIRYESTDSSVWSQVAILARLKTVRSGRTFLVGVTHLKSKEGEKNEKRRTESLKQLLQHASETKNSHEPVVILGDFNTDAEGHDYLSTYKTIMEHPLGLKSAYRTNSKEPEYTTCKVRKQETCHTIDYIWVPEDTVILSKLEIPDKSSLPDCRLPCFEYPSDHLSIGCDVLF